MAADPRPAARIVDATATRRKLLADRECRACGREAGSGHHLIPKGERGDDVVENIVPVCGDGTKGCHGALHGTPYIATSWPADGGPPGQERRDSEWVRRRIGERLHEDEIGYVLGRLGDVAGIDYIRRSYYRDAA